MSWILLTFISVLFRSTYGVMTKVMSNVFSRISVYGQAVALPLAAAIISLILIPLVGGFSVTANLSLATLFIVPISQGLGNLTYFQAIKSLENSTAQLAFSSILIFNTVLAVIFYGLSLSGMNLIGVFVLMLAILIVISGKIVFDKTGFLWMMLAAFLFAIFQLSSSELSSQVSASSYLLVSYLGAALCVFVFKPKLVTADFKIITKHTKLAWVSLLTASFSVGNFLLAYYAYRAAPEPSKVAILLTSQMVLTILLSYVFLKERGRLGLKLLAAVLVVVAAYLIKS